MLQAKELMDSSAAALNDTGLTKFTYLKQIPYLNIAIKELEEVMQSNNISVTNEQNTSIIILAGATEIAAIDMPTDMVEPRVLYERDTNSSEDWQLMSKVDFLPPFVELLQSLIYWCYINQEIKFIGATSDRQLKLQYIARRQPKIVDPTNAITILNADTFLIYRNAALCAQYIGENKERADELNINAGMALDRFLSINNKSRQSSPVRRRPFMAGYKVRTGF